MKIVQHHDLSIEVKSRCISLWKEPWTKRLSRVTLLVEHDGKFAVVKDTSCDFWFLPGGGVEQGESTEEAAKREATEELGLKIRINQVIKTFHVTLTCQETKEQLKIHPFIAVHAISTGGPIKTEYAPNRKIFFLRRDECISFLQELEFSEEYECMKPYLCVSKEIIREFFRH